MNPENPTPDGGNGPVVGGPSNLGAAFPQPNMTPHQAPSYSQSTPVPPAAPVPPVPHAFPVLAVPPVPPVPPAPQPYLAAAQPDATPPPAPPVDTHPAARPRGKAKRGIFLPVATTAVLAAVLASVGTAAVTGQLDADNNSGTSNSTSFGNIGKQSNNSVNVPVASSSVDNPDWPAVSAAVAPSVVAIEVTTAEGTAQGSGVIIDDEGHILTNDHVVSGAKDDMVRVTLSDGRIYDAKIVGLDPATDLAVLKLVDPPSDLRPAVFADSDKGAVGEPVMAMGNPLGLANTATTGIISAINRPVNTGTTTDQTSVVTNAIQIDAAINPGNSGGPLFNARGEVIGITSSIASLTSGSGQSGSIGLGFAIPASLAQNIGNQLIKNGVAEHAFLGVSLADGTGTADGTTRQGAVVKDVTAGSPAAEAKLQVDDVIVGIDGAPVTGAESLTGFVRALPSGQEVTLTVIRDGKALDIKVKLATKPEPASQPSTEDGSSGSGQQAPGQDGQGNLGPDNPGNLPDFSDLLPGQNG